MPQNEPDPLEPLIEKALRPGRFIDWRATREFFDGLEVVHRQIDAVPASGEGARAVTLCEAFIAGCLEKTDEVNDSADALGLVIVELVGSWIKARQSAGADATKTVLQLYRWMNVDAYGHLSTIEESAARLLDRAGLAAFEQVVREDIAAQAAPPPGAKWFRLPFAARRVNGILKAIAVAREDPQAYLALCADRLTPRDCERLARIHQARGEWQDALSWVDRAAALENDPDSRSEPAWGLTTLREDLLMKLGRAREALDLAWVRFEKHPGKNGFADLERLVPGSELPAWRKRALERVQDGPLAGCLEVCVAIGELEVLSTRILAASDSDLAGLSHFVTEPAAAKLRSRHPAAAAKLFTALALRILGRRKSRYYDAALENLGSAKACYETAGLSHQWSALVRLLRTEHGRLKGIQAGLDEIERGADWSKRLPFLDRARSKWMA